MPERNTSDEVRTKQLTAMPDPLGDIFNRLWKEIVIVHNTWTIFRTLFAESQATLDLLNATAGSFFRDAARAFGESLTLHICRLTDPASQGKYRNLSLEQLAQNIPDTTVRSETERLVTEASQYANQLREWRDKWLAHKDLARKFDDFQPATLTLVEDALSSIRAVFHRVESHYLNGSHTMFESPLSGQGDVKSLIYYLHRGHDAVKAVRQESLE